MICASGLALPWLALPGSVTLRSYVFRRFLEHHVPELFRPRRVAGALAQGFVTLLPFGRLRAAARLLDILGKFPIRGPERGRLGRTTGNLRLFQLMLYSLCNCCNSGIDYENSSLVRLSSGNFSCILVVASRRLAMRKTTIGARRAIQEIRSNTSSHNSMSY